MFLVIIFLSDLIRMHGLKHSLIFYWQPVNYMLEGTQKVNNFQPCLGKLKNYAMCKEYQMKIFNNSLIMYLSC